MFLLPNLYLPHFEEESQEFHSINAGFKRWTELGVLMAIARRAVRLSDGKSGIWRDGSQMQRVGDLGLILALQESEHL